MFLKSISKRNIPFFALLLLSVVFFLVTLRINIFRYNNFDYGKFDLGNMSQMLWNTLHGRLLYLTDYFGTNLPRWAMSHVDPVLLLFLPVFFFFQSPMTLVVCQLILVVFSSLLIYLISELKFKSPNVSALLGASFLLYPAFGYLTAFTGFHGVTVVIPAFLGAFYIFEKMYLEGRFTRGGLAVFWMLLVITMAGKEQLPLYIFLYGAFILLFRRTDRTFKHAISMMVVSFVWFFLAFFVIIPHYSKYRIEGYKAFAQSLNMVNASTRDVSLPNYFLSRYEAFGESYSEIGLNMLTDPQKVIRVFFAGDNPDNLRRVFEPLGYLPFFYPQIFIISAPDFLSNYLTSAGGIGTGEISNHRISMIIPVLFLSVIYGVDYLSSTLSKFIPGFKNKKGFFSVLISILLLVLNIRTSHMYNNPVYLWFTQAVGRRISGFEVFAKNIDETISKNMAIGDVVKITPLEDKDRECALEIIKMIPKDASISGPDYLGAHMSLRETYAIFPALYNSADYVILDIFSRKLLSILDISLDMSRDIVERMIKSNNYKLMTGCGNLFVFKKTEPYEKSAVLPLQERYLYSEKVNLPFFEGLYIVDYSVPEEFERGVSETMNITYAKKEEKRLDDYVMFTTFVNNSTGKVYQAANLPSFGLKQPREWKLDRYYNERVEIILPQYLDTGSYKVFVGMSNKIRTRSIYLGDTLVL